MARRPLFPLTLCALAIMLAACSPSLIELTGRVVDTAGGPLAGAIVKVGESTVTTDASGSFSLSDLQPGTYSIDVSAPGKLSHQGVVVLDKRPEMIEIVLEDIPVPPGCEPKGSDPEGMKLVYCQTFATGETPGELGWQIGSGAWRIVDDGGKRWIEGTSDGGQRWAYVSIPEMAQANKVVLEYTATYVSAGNTWAVEFPADQPEQAHGTTFMALSAWDGVYMRRYHENNAVLESTVISPPKVMPGEVTTFRITYDKSVKQIDLLRNGVRPPEYPITLPDTYLITGAENTLLKLYLNVGGAAGDTTVRWTDIKVWVD